MANKESASLRRELEQLQDKAHDLFEDAKKLIEKSKDLQKQMDGRSTKNRGSEER